jgi:hypothetical protein
MSVTRVPDKTCPDRGTQLNREETLLLLLNIYREYCVVMSTDDRITMMWM